MCTESKFCRSGLREYSYTAVQGSLCSIPHVGLTYATMWPSQQGFFIPAWGWLDGIAFLKTFGTHRVISREERSRKSFNAVGYTITTVWLVKTRVRGGGLRVKSRGPDKAVVWQLWERPSPTVERGAVVTQYIIPPVLLNPSV
jgi:hypothetical protein